MKIMMVSRDQNLIQLVKKFVSPEHIDLQVYDDSDNPLDVMSAICTQNPSLLLVDDDFISPHSAHLLSSVRKINHNMDIIFTTSNPAIELGKEISQLGIHYYAIKPLEESELADSLTAAVDLINRRIY
jgi:response regulator of citrate/malate metabolism